MFKYDYLKFGLTVKYCASYTHCLYSLRTTRVSHILG